VNFLRINLERHANRHVFGIAYGLMAISSLFLLPALNADMQGDLYHYRGIANAYLSGALPYRDQVMEYPPYVFPIFLIPRIFGNDNYFEGFVALALAADWLVKLLLFSLGLRQSKTLRALWPLLLYCAAIPFLRFFFLQRYDIFPALICLAALWLFCSQRYFLCGLAVAIGIGVKLYPALFVLPLFILAFRQNKSKPFILGLTVGLAPILLLSFYLPWWRFAQFQADRGLQVESLYASVLWLGNLLSFFHMNWIYTKFWYEVQGSPATALLTWSRLLFAGTVLISVAATVRATWCPERPSFSELTRILFLPLLAFVAFNQVLSPQYMIWLMPLAALTIFDGKRWLSFAICLATMLTPIIYPSLHGDYGSGLDLFETIVLLLRNLTLLVAWICLFREILQKCNFRIRRLRPVVILSTTHSP
jgi:hypothetical protein